MTATIAQTNMRIVVKMRFQYSMLLHCVDISLNNTHPMLALMELIFNKCLIKCGCILPRVCNLNKLVSRELKWIFDGA